MSALYWAVGRVGLTETAIGQTSWSKALVRHGADAQTALAKVLGVAARQILERDGSDQIRRPSSRSVYSQGDVWFRP